MVDLTHHWQRLSGDLSTLAHLGGPELEQAVERLLPALEPAARLRLVEALSQASDELNALIPALRVTTRVAADHLTYEVESEEAAAEVSGDLDARITLRLPEELKFRIEAAAESEGVSLNAWLIKALARSTSQALTLGPGPVPPRPVSPERPLPPSSVGRQLRGRGRA